MSNQYNRNILERLYANYANEDYRAARALEFLIRGSR